MLCKTCLKAIRAAEVLYSTPRTQHESKLINEPHHRTWRELQVAIDIGCYSCCRLRWLIPSDIWTFWREISDEGQHPLRWMVSGIWYPEGTLPAPAFTFQLKGNFEELGMERYGLSQGGVVTLSFHGKRTERASEGLLPDASEGHQKSSSTIKALAQARDWFQSCQSSHSSCQQLQPNNVDYPDLLLDLTPSDAGESSWRLVDTTNERIKGDYMTLSHRWSDGDITKLTLETETDMKRGKPRSSLYHVYQDAMDIADHLGVRYLWIDSLCIFQDTRLDIKKAAQEMDKVYGNSVCNISALSGSSASIFQDRPNTLINPGSLHVSADAHNLDFSYEIKDLEILSDALRYQILSKRGWIYQEQVLARRTLYFGRTQVLWNCLSGTACELIPDIATWATGGQVGEFSLSGLREVNGAALVANKNRNDISNSKSRIPSLSHSELSRIWNRVVSGYSGRDLTFADDRILAIAGITRLLADASQDTYLAGLWRSGLPQQLVWGARDTSCRVSPKYRAPSWSWASINGPVSFEPNTPKCVSIARVIEAQVQYDPINQFHSVTGGHILVEAPYLEIPLSELKTARPQLFDAAASRANTTIIFDDIHEKRNPSVPGVALCIQIVVFEAGGRTLHGILLEACSDQSSAVMTGESGGNAVKQYKRVGLFKRSIRSEPSLPPMYEDLLRLIRNPGPDLEATFDFEKAHMLKRFRIV